MSRILRALIALAFALCLVAVPAADAQQSDPGPDPEQLQSPETIDALVARMSDDAVRALLLDYLNTRASEATARRRRRR